MDFETQYREFLRGKIASPSVDSYVGYIAHVERKTGNALTPITMNCERHVQQFAHEARRCGVHEKTARNFVSAARKYLDFIVDSRMCIDQPEQLG